jgi:hypothetical protein
MIAIIGRDDDWDGTNASESLMEEISMAIRRSCVLHDRMSELVRVLAVVVLMSTAVTGCDEDQELREIERGRDNPPGIDASPPDEAN